MTKPRLSAVSVPVAQSTWEGHEKLVRQLAERLHAAGVRPDIVVGLEASGAYGAALLKTLLGADHMAVLDVARDEDGEGGVDYSLGGFVQLDGRLSEDMVVLCFDDSGRRFELMTQLVAAVRAVGGTPIAAVIIRVGNEPLPDELGEVTYLFQQDRSPNWPWKQVQPL